MSDLVLNQVQTQKAQNRQGVCNTTNNSEHADSVQWIKQLSTECISEYQKMGRYADQERVAKETLQDSWKVIQSEYNK